MSKAREIAELARQVDVDNSGNADFSQDISASNITVDANITVGGTVDGRDLAADGAKLDAIEAGAEANPTASEIKTAYESNADTNAFTDAEKAKLSTVEAGATGDQTASEIKTAYESNADTNAFTDAEKTKLAGVEAGATADQTITAGSGLTGGGTGNVTLSHSDTSSQASVANTGNNFIQEVSLDEFGHVTYLASATVPIPNIYDSSTSSTGYFALPTGTTAQRPASASAGWSRFNTDKNSFEYFNGTDWLASDQMPVISGLSGTVYKGVSANITLTVAETSDLFSVRYFNGSTLVDSVSGQTQSNGSCVTAVPSSVYNNLTGGTTVTVRIVNENGIQSNTSQSFVLNELPSGGTITTYGSYRVHKFTSSGTFTAGTFSGNVEYIVVAGGGGGGNRGSRWGGAGGAGGLRSSISGVNSGGGVSAESPLAVSSGQSLTVVIGGGGGPGAMSSGTGGQGGTSSFGSITTVGGGGGGSYGGGNGGSGGGGSNGSPGGSGTAGQGFNGGNSTDQGYGGGGGGAAGAGGQNSRGAALSFTDKVQSGTVSLALGGGMNTGAGAANTGNGGDAGFGGGADSGGSGVVYIRYQI